MWKTWSAPKSMRGSSDDSPMLPGWKLLVRGRLRLCQLPASLPRITDKVNKLGWGGMQNALNVLLRGQ